VLKRVTIFIICVIFILFLVGCDNANTTGSVNGDIRPDENQPEFPELTQYWVVDPDNYLQQSTIDSAHETLEKLRQDGIAEVAIVIQEGIKNHGPFNDEKIWAMKWGRWIKLGDKEDERAIVWLIRPDVEPEENRVTIEVSTHLTWLTAVDYGPALEEAAEYANADDFDGAVESITRNTNEILRKIWKEKGR
jgi:hypothetical protein